LNKIARAIKTLLLVGAATLLVTAPAISHAEEPDEARDVTAQCAVSAPAERRAVTRMRDNNVYTYTAFAPGEPFSCTWPQEAGARGVYIKWYAPPDSAILVQTGENGAELSRETVQSPPYNDFYTLSDAARGLTIVSETGMRIAEVSLYSTGRLPDGVHDWQPSAGKADLLVVSAHCDDELLFFGGTIPYYAGGRGLTVQVAYMANGDRSRVDEALNGLWHCGVRNAPVFLPLPDIYTNTLRDALIRWGEETTTGTLVSLIRRFRPEVIVTHDLNGEYGHGAHMATAYCMVQALPLAADDILFPDSVREFGAWQAQKLYLHLHKENAITMDWNGPLSAFDGKTALQIANEAYHMHTSQLEYNRNIFAAGKYSSAAYGLAFSAVGADTAKDDFFEHIDPARLSNYIAPEPVATPAQTAAPNPSATPAATIAPQRSVQEEQPMENNSLSLLLISGISAFAAAAAATTAVVMIRKKRKQK
jgi:LmbE family N-acetylglucosaminyl deacetylase